MHANRSAYCHCQVNWETNTTQSYVSTKLVVTIFMVELIVKITGSGQSSKFRIWLIQFYCIESRGCFCSSCVISQSGAKFSGKWNEKKGSLMMIYIWIVMRVDEGRVKAHIVLIYDWCFLFLSIDADSIINFNCRWKCHVCVQAELHPCQVCIKFSMKKKFSLFMGILRIWAHMFEQKVSVRKIL